MSASPGYGIIGDMNAFLTILLIILLVIVVLIGVSLALGRTTREAQSVRDDEFAELDGSWIRYRVTGQGPPVLLVHGFLSSSRIWERLAGRLAGRHTVYSLDLRGFGESDKPIRGYGVRHGSRLLYLFCSQFKLGKVAVVGHDVGGDMAVKLAADHPELVRSVTLVSTPANEEQIDLPTLLWLATLPVIGPLFYALGQYVGFVRRLWMRPFVSEKESLSQRLVEDAALSTPAAVRSTFNTARREISRERVARQAHHLRVPMLVVAGEEDQIVDPQATETWSNKAPRSEVAVLACGHLPMIELPEEFEARLLSFLEGGGRYTSSDSGPRYRPTPEDVPLVGPRPAVEPEETGGIDGLEPDEEASAAGGSYYAEASGGSGVEGARAAYGEDETGELGYTPGSHPGREPGTGGRNRRSGGVKRDEEIIPEIPEDLFHWSDIEETRRRRERGESRENGDRPG